MNAPAVSPGRRVLALVREALEPAPPFVEDGADGFAWWPLWGAQSFALEGPVRTAGVPLERVRVRLEILRGVEGSAEHFAALSSWNARHPGLSALRWNGDDGAVSLEACVLAPESAVDEAARVLASTALLQLGDAVRDLAELADALGGERADSPAPGCTVRAEPDALCEAWRRYAEAGEPATEPRAWLERAAAMTPPPWRRARVEGGGLHAELPCALPGEQPADAPGEGVAMLHLLVEQPHPVLGAGVLSVLRLPADAEPVEARRFSTAALLNEGEVREWTGVEALGAWCVHPAAGLSHVAFHPALLVDDALAGSLAWGAGVRARWALAFLARVARMRGAR